MMTTPTETKKTPTKALKNWGSLLFGVALLIIGLFASFYNSKAEWYPYQIVGVILIFIGIIFVGLALFYSPKETKDEKQSSEQWKATDRNVNTKVFEESRKSLLATYNSYVQNHAGYLIAFVIGLIALFTTSSAFFKLGSPAFFISLGFIIFLIGFDVLRMQYWNALVNTTILVSKTDAIEHFNKANKISSDSPIPEIAFLQLSVYYFLCDRTRDEKLSFWDRKLLWLQLRTAGKIARK